MRLPLKRLSILLFLLTLLGLRTGGVSAQDKGQGSLVVTVQKETDSQIDATVQIFAQGTTDAVATTRLGAPVGLPPGTYRIAFDVLGGKIMRDNVLVKAGRASTVLINNLAGIQINVLDRNGKDLGVTVEVHDSVSGEKLGAFLSGDVILAYPGVVDIKVGVPPQSQWMRKVELHNNVVERMNFREQTPGQLLVKPLLHGQDASAFTQVIISQGGSNKEIARSEPGREHHFTLSPGTYDILVMNSSGVGKPFVQDRAELTGSETVEKEVELDDRRSPNMPADPKSL